MKIEVESISLYFKIKKLYFLTEKCSKINNITKSLEIVHLKRLNLMYLFCHQAKQDFVNDFACLDKVRGEEEISRFKNECLGMAVLHLSHTALQTGCSLQDVAKQTRCRI